MSWRTRIFVLITSALGVACLASAVAAWYWPEPKLFLLYLSFAVICSFVQIRGVGGGMSFSANLPVILISILRLSPQEALVVGCVAAVAQGFWNKHTRSRPSQIALSACIMAVVIATANFAYQSVMPQSVRSATVRLFAASVALFFANTFPAAIAMRLNKGKRLGQVWKESYFWLFPYYLVAAAIANVLNAASGGISLDTALLVLPVIYVAWRYYGVQKSQLAEKEKHAGNMAALHLRAIEGLALAVEAKDNLNTRGHLRRVQVYSLGIGKEMGLNGEELEALQAAALLHDIGKLAVPEYILTKPGKLSAEEFAKMKVHPLVGAEIVEQVQFPYPVAPIVRAHHEKWDGSGYPLGLKGEEIPLGARILTAADYLDALTSDREYRRAIPLDEAMQHVASESGKTFDPRVVSVLQRRYQHLDLEVKSGADELPALSKHTRVENGKTPDAGLDLCALSGFTSGAESSDFLGSIAAAGREGQLLLDMSHGIVASLDLKETLQRLEDGLRPMIPFNAMAVFLQQGDTLLAEHAAGDNEAMLWSLEVAAGEGLTGWVAQNRQPVVNGNPTVDPGFRCDPDKNLNAAIALPLEGSRGLLGVIALYRRDHDSFTSDHLRILMALAPRIGTAVENALKYREMEEKANTDFVTGLPNLHLMMKALESELGTAKRHKQSLAIAVSQVAGLSSLGRKPGQPDADEFLRSAAKSMRDSCREYDHIARIGEDKFAIILPGMRREDLGGKIATLNANMADACRRLGGCGTVHFNAGEALYPDDADSAKLLLEIAERRTEPHLTTETESILALGANTSKAEVSKTVQPLSRG
jgi:diguanylate cyclase (GGDEF)-like protein/putative nucleotidyltransferase with HDIG domain